MESFVKCLRRSYRPLVTLLILTVAMLSSKTGFAQDLPIIEATTPIQINANLVTNGDVTDFQISPDNQYAVYLADQITDEKFELFSVKMDGSSQPIKLSIANPVTNGDVLSIVGFSADGQRVIYSADQTTDGIEEAISVKLDGTSRITLTPGFTGSNEFTILELSPDQSRLVYLPRPGGIIGLTTRHIYSVSVDGSTSAVRLNNNFGITDSVVTSDFDFSRDSSKIIYRASQNGTQELHIANTDGSGTALRLDTNGDGQGLIVSFEVSNDNSRVVYQSNQNSDDQFELFSVAATGGAVVRLNTTLPSGAEVEDFRMNTLNSNFVYYIADQTVLDRREVFSVKITGGTPQRISPIVTSDSTASFQSHNENGTFISYLFLDRSTVDLTFRGISQSTNQDLLISSRITLGDFATIVEGSSGNFTTFLSRESGSLSRKLISLELAENATNNRVLISEDDSYIYGLSLRHISENEQIVSFTSTDLLDDDLNNLADSPVNLFVTSLKFGDPVRLSPNLPVAAEITQTLTSDNAGYVLYTANQSTVGQFNLYASAITVNEPEDDEIDELCLPIKTTSGAVAVICL